MEAIADLPAFSASPEHVPFINPSNARDLANKRWAMQREREERERNAPAPAIAPASEPDLRRARMIARKEEQMDKLDDDIDACSDPKMIHFLTGSRERVFNEWCVLTGTAKPAPRKTSEKPNRQRVMVEPS